jgi:aspartyl-tRNA(Asn)/glutamyl-tRNA(Gln) amidotransferase subunit B
MTETASPGADAPPKDAPHVAGHTTSRIGHNQANLIDGATGPWELIVGLEVHAQVTSNAKLFSGAATAFGGAPNSHVSLIDAAMPGMLPVINEECVRQAVRTGLGLNARINRRSVFDRKNYFYPDLPQGYQISQYLQPIVGAGVVSVDLDSGETVEIGIERLHLEQDAGKSVHDLVPNKTCVDLNRSGVALMEIVSRPDMRSAEEAAAFLGKLRSILRYLGTCDGNMQEGSMRADVNVSVRRPDGPLGTRCEIKNVNSLRFVRQAIEYEARRQIEILEEGGSIIQETRLFDANRGETRSMRSKEEAHDYRYFPDPDLLPLEFDQAFVDALAADLPELPDAKKARFVNRFGLSQYQAGVLTAERAVAEAFEQKISDILAGKFKPDEFGKVQIYIRGFDSADISADARLIVEASASASANTITSSVFSIANDRGENTASLIKRLDLAGLQTLIDDEVISGRIAKDVLMEMVDNPGMSAGDIVEKKGLKQITDTGALEAIVDGLIAANPEQAEQYRSGNTKVAGWFTGQAMKATRGQANPQMINELLQAKLGG